MEEAFLQNLYRKCLNPYSDIPDEFINKSDTDFDQLNLCWTDGIPFTGDWQVEDWIRFQMEHDMITTSELDWQIFKQVIDDLLLSDNLKGFEGVIKFSVIPKVKKYPAIINYNFSYEPHLRDYTEKVFDWLRYLNGHLFSIKELGEFENGEFQFILKGHQKERLQALKNIITEVEKDNEQHEQLDIAYELDYKYNEILIKGASDYVHKLNDGYPTQILFEQMWEHPNEKITLQELRAQGIDLGTSRKFNDLLKDTKLIGKYGLLFIKKNQDSAVLNKVITHTMLKEKGLEYLSPNELVKLLKKKT